MQTGLALVECGTVLLGAGADCGQPSRPLPSLLRNGIHWPQGGHAARRIAKAPFLRLQRYQAKPKR